MFRPLTPLSVLVILTAPLPLTLPAIFKPLFPEFVIANVRGLVFILILPVSVTFKPPAPSFVNVPFPPIFTVPEMFIPSGLVEVL